MDAAKPSAIRERNELAVCLSPIALIRHAIRIWRERAGGSREAVAAHIVAVHEALGLDRISGIHFDTSARTPAERLRLNTERIFCWLDDDGKDDDLLPLNCLPTVLIALPLDLRVQVVEALIGAAGLRVEVRSGGDGVLCLGRLLRRIVKDNGEVAAAMAQAVRDPAATCDALRALHRASATLQDATASIEAQGAQDEP